MSEPGEQRFGVLLAVAYDGASFSGFARQTNARTIAGELDGAVRAIDERASLVRGTSRTDAGVHALRHPVAFDTCLDVPPRGWALSLAAHLPDEIAPVHAARVVAGYDPRHHALRKTYRYLIHQARLRDPFLRTRSWRVGEWLNHEAMRTEAALLLGTHDFRAFRTSADERTETVRTLFRAEVRVETERNLTIVDVEGDRFMHRMVRIIVGTLVDVGRGRTEPGAVSRALSNGMRTELGITAPPDGLYLARVELDGEGRAAGPGPDNWPDHSASS